MQNDVTLKPCPFCGGGDFVVEPEPWSWVHCDGCDTNGPVTETKAEAIAAWNQRAEARKAERAAVVAFLSGNATLAQFHWGAPLIAAIEAGEHLA